MSLRRDHVSRAFTLIELLVVIAIIALLIAILLPSLNEARAAGRKGVCASNLKQFGIAYNTYASDYQDRIASFTWGSGQSNSQYSDLNNATDDNAAAVNQAVDIIRRRAERDNFPKPSNWTPYARYSHLVMMDYLAARLPEKMVACPDDKNLLGWQSDPLNPPDPAPSDSNLRVRIPYSSSFILVPAAYSPDKPSGTVQTVGPATSHDQYNIPNTPLLKLGRRKLTDVINPSTKVCMYDQYQRHTGSRSRTLWYGYPEATSPVLFWDSSVRDIKSQNVNPGVNPNTGAPALVRYEPDTAYEPPTKNGAAFYISQLWYAFTKDGLAGVDVGGRN